MPSFVGAGIPRLSEMTIDTNLTIPWGKKIICSTYQALSGHTTDFNNQTGVKLFEIGDDSIQVTAPTPLYVDTIREKTGSNRVVFPHGIKTDTIDDNGGADIDILEHVAMASGKKVYADSSSISLIRNRAETGAVQFSTGIQVDNIAEYTGAHGIVFDNEALMSAVEALLTQRYRTAAAGATARYTSAAEATIPNPGATPTQIKSTVTVPVWYAGASNTLRISFEGKAQNVSANDEMYITINDVEVGTRLALSNAGYATKSQDFGSISAGDTIKIMVVNPAGTGGTMYCKNFVISSTDTVNLPMTTETWP